MPPSRTTRPIPLILAALLLVTLFGLCLGSLRVKSLTVYEGLTAARGYAVWRGGPLLPADHPPLADLLTGLGALLEPSFPAPSALPGLAAGDLDAFSQALLWGSGVPVARAALLIRLPTVWLAVLLGAVVWRWACDVNGPWGATVALALTALSPNLLAFARLATPDFAVAASFTMALFGWARYQRHPSLLRFLAASLVLGLALSSGYPAWLLLIVLPVLAAWAARRASGRSAAPVGRTLAIVAAGVIVLLGVTALAARQFPLGPLQADAGRFLAGRFAGRSYLLGRFTERNWWYGPLVVLGLKLPIPTILLWGLAVMLAAIRGPHRGERAFILPAALYGVALLALQLGPEMRYLLPILPLMFLFAGRVATLTPDSGVLRPVIALTLITVLALANAFVYPDYLSFFNLLGGGADRGSRYLVGSNLDWGQDLPALADYLAGRGDGPVHLSYFGSADPAAYGIDYIPVEAGEGQDGVPFPPLDPPPGLYAISATNVVGAGQGAIDAFGIFRAMEPIARVGHSIYVYQVPDRSLAVDGGGAPWLARCAEADPQPDAAGLARLTGSDALRVVTFDCTQALAFPDGQGWILLPAGVEPVIPLGDPDFVGRQTSGRPAFNVWARNEPPIAPEAPLEFPAVRLPVPVAGYLELLGYETGAATVARGEDVVLTSYWRVRQSPPLDTAFFVEVAASEGVNVAAVQGIGVGVDQWVPGMVFVQQHRVAIPPETAPGEYALTIGLYSVPTGERYPVFSSGTRVVDRISLRNVVVTE